MYDPPVSRHSAPGLDTSSPRELNAFQNLWRSGMYGYERSYKTGRTVGSFLEIVAWIVVAIGVITSLYGLASGGFFGIVLRNFGNSDTPFILRIVAMLPGIVTTALGLFFVMQCQQARATLDTAEMTRELLEISRGESIPNRGSSIDIASEFPRYLDKIRYAKRTGSGKIVIQFDNGKINEYTDIEEARKYLS